jgi:hypothetical protein
VPKRENSVPSLRMSLERVLEKLRSRTALASFATASRIRRRVYPESP